MLSLQMGIKHRDRQTSIVGIGRFKAPRARKLDLGLSELLSLSYLLIYPLVGGWLSFASDFENRDVGNSVARANILPCSPIT